MNDPSSEQAAASDLDSAPGETAGVLHWALVAALVGVFFGFCRDRAGLLTVVLAAQALSIAGGAVLYLVLRVRRVPIEEISLFSGQALFRWRIGTTACRVGWFPFGFSVRVPEDSPTRPRAERALVAVALLLVPVSTALTLLGAERALHSITSGFQQLISGALSPWTVAPEQVGEWARILADGNLAIAVGVLFAKFVSIDLMFSMPMRLIQLFAVRGGARGAERTRQIDHVAAIVFLLQMTHSVLWTIGISRYFFFVA